MKALVKTAPGVGNLEVKDVPEPTPASGQVLIEVAAGAICGTDLHIHDDEYPNSPPFVLGHEMSGVIVEIGAGVEGLAAGDRVSSETFKFTCGQCRFCRAGLIGLCVERQSMGVHVDGAFARFVCQRQESVHKLPDNVDLEAGALCEPTAVAVRAVYERASVNVDDVVLVSGPGPVGLLCVQAARARGAKVVLAGAPGDDARLAMGESMGADVIVQVAEAGAFAALAEMTNGMGADVAIECGGSAGSLQQCIEQARKGAQVALVGLYGRNVEVELDAAIIKEQTLLPSFTYGHGTWERTMELLAAAAIDPAPLVSGRYLLETWEEAFALARSRRGHKYLLLPTS